MTGYYNPQGWLMPPVWSPNPQYPQPSGYYGQPQQQKPVNNLLKVTGPESAKAYNLPPNSSVVLFDANEALFYLVSTDDSGFKTMRTFIFSEQETAEPQPAPQPVPDMDGYVTKDDLGGFATKKDLDALKKQLADISKDLKELI